MNTSTLRVRDYLRVQWRAEVDKLSREEREKYRLPLLLYYTTGEAHETFLLEIHDDFLLTQHKDGGAKVMSLFNTIVNIVVMTEQAAEVSPTTTSALT